MSLIEPLAAAPLWRQVITADDGQCRCTGDCGRRHAFAAGRCPAGIEDLLAVRLYVASVDPGVPVEQAWRLPVEQLGAWCGRCLDGLSRQQRPRPAPELTGDLLALLDTSPAEAPPARPRRSRARRGPPS